MMKKRFLLALIAVSMSLAGCGNKDKTEETGTTDVTPTDDTSHDGGDTGGDTGGEEDKDALTPEQRENAGQIQIIMKMALGYVGQYDEETVTSIDEFTLAYSEEIALEDVSFAAVGSALAPALSLDTSDPKAIVDFAVSLKESESLDDVAYFAVALGKSFLRAEGKVNEEYPEVFEYFADYLDEEKTDLHKNIYGFLDSIVGCAGLLTSEELVEAAGKVYDAEENQLNFEGISGVLTTVGDALTALYTGYENASYLANLVVGGLTGFADEVLELDEEVLDFLNEFDVQSIIDACYQTVGMAGLVLPLLGSEESPVKRAVELINFALAEEYMSLVFGIFGDFMKIIGITEEEWKTGVSSLLGASFTVLGTVDSIVKQLSQDFVDEETGKFSAELLQAAVVCCGEQIEVLGELSSLATTFDDFLVLVVHNTLTVLGNYEEEAAAEIANKFDVKDEIESVYGEISNVGDFIKNLDDQVFEIVAHFVNEEFSEGFEELLTYMGYECDFAEVQAQFEAVKENVMGIVAHFDSEEFAEKVAAAYNAETKRFDLEKVKELILDAGETLEGFLDTKENVKALGDVVVSALKEMLIKGGLSEEDVEEIFEGFDVDAFVDMVYGYIEMGIGFIKGVGSTDEFDAYLKDIKNVVEVFLDENSTTEIKVFAVLDAVFDVIFTELDIQSMDKLTFEFTLFSPVIYVMGIRQQVASEEFAELLSNLVVTDLESGVRTVDGDAVKALAAEFGTYAYMFKTSAEALVSVVDVFREIIEKIEGNYDPEVEGEQYVSIKAALTATAEKLGEVADLLQNNDDTLEPYVEMIVEYGNLVLEGYALYEESEEEGFIEGYKVTEYIVRVASMFIESEHEEFAITAFDEITGKVGETIGLESIQEEIAEGGSCEFIGRGVAFDLLENEGEYTLEVTLVSESSISVVDGEVTEVSITGEVYTFPLPSEVVVQLLAAYQQIQGAFLVE